MSTIESYWEQGKKLTVDDKKALALEILGTAMHNGDLEPEDILPLYKEIADRLENED